MRAALVDSGYAEQRGFCIRNVLFFREIPMCGGAGWGDQSYVQISETGGFQDTFRRYQGYRYEIFLGTRLKSRAESACYEAGFTERRSRQNQINNNTRVFCVNKTIPGKSYDNKNLDYVCVDNLGRLIRQDRLTRDFNKI